MFETRVRKTQAHSTRFSLHLQNRLILLQTVTTAITFFKQSIEIVQDYVTVVKIDSLCDTSFPRARLAGIRHAPKICSKKTPSRTDRNGWESLRPPPWSYLKFGGGPRVCPGQNLALTEVAYAIVKIVQAFKSIENRDPVLDFVEVYKITIDSGNGAKVSMVPA